MEPALESHFEAHKRGVTGLGASNTQCEKFASCSSDKTVRLWRLGHSQNRSYIYYGHEGSVNSVALARNAEFLASASSDCTVRLWSPEHKGETASVRAHTAPIQSVDLSPDSESLATGANDKMVKVWKVANLRFSLSLTGHTNWVRCVKFFANSGKLLASCGDDKTVKLWDATSRSCVGTLEGHTSAVYCVDPDLTGCYLVSSSGDHSVRIWDIRMRKLVQLYSEHDCRVFSCCFHPSGGWVMSGSEDRTLKIYDLTEARIVYTLHGHQGPILAVTFLDDGSKIISGDQTGSLFVWKSHLEHEHHADTQPSTEPSSPEKRPKMSNVSSIEPCSKVLRQRQKLNSENGHPLTSSRIKNAAINGEASCRCRTEEKNGKGGSGIESGGSKRSGGTMEYLQRSFSEILSQLDTLTQTVAVIEQRVTSLENKVEDINQQLNEPDVLYE